MSAVHLNRQRATTTGYLPTLDGWRALAITAVLLSHDMTYHIGPLTSEWFHHDGGALGVTTFFILSGLLICSRLLHEEASTGHINRKKFYLRRLCRLQPTALLYLLTVAVLSVCKVLEPYPAGLICALLLVRNYFPADGPMAGRYTGHFWSLSIEEHFYLLFPTFLVLVRRRRELLLSAILVVLILWRTYFIYHLTIHFGSNIWKHTDVAVHPMVIGALGALLLRRKRVSGFALAWMRPWPVLGVTALLWWFYETAPGRISGLLAFASPGLLLVSTMLHPESLPGRFLELAPLRFLGRISYSVYLWQGLFFGESEQNPLLHQRLLHVLQAPGMRYLVVLLISTACYFLVERPFIHLGHKLTKQPEPVRAPVTAEQAANALV